MTKQRFDKHSTEFGLWVRIPEELDSKKGFENNKEVLIKDHHLFV